MTEKEKQRRYIKLRLKQMLLQSVLYHLKRAQETPVLFIADLIKTIAAFALLIFIALLAAGKISF